MIRSIAYSDLINGKLKDDYVLIDVRSPGEYKTATIPGAISIPLFDDEERKIIGTAYTHDSIENAKKLGIEVISKRLPQIFDRILELKRDYNSIIFFCAREGMRSSSLAALIFSLGINAYKLKGGYKGYRDFINKSLPVEVSHIKFVVIHGNTGVGKTEILKNLSSAGCDVLDLEKCANHRGSFFGSVGLGDQNSQKQFESLIYETLRKRKSETVIVEGESKRIGKVIIPEYIFKAMVGGVHIKIEADIDYRVNNILSDYLNGTKEEIIDALNLLRKHMSDRTVDSYINMIKSNNYKEVVKELMEKYYDPMYENENKDFELVLKSESMEETCREILAFLENR